MRPEDLISNEELLEVNMSFNSKRNHDDLQDQSQNGDDKNRSES